MQRLKLNLFRGKPVVRFHVMAKPIGPTCNLDCEYCFYLSKENLLNTDNKWIMSDEVLENFVRQYIDNQNYQEVVFSWQGGEPTFGILLNDEWCEFLRENNFLVGLSIDGPKELYDTYRKDKSKKGTFERVYSAAQLLKKYGVPFNALVTINRKNAKFPLDVYRFLRDDVAPRAIQFSPCVEPSVFTKKAPH